MPDPLVPSTGLGVLHLFCRVPRGVDAVERAVVDRGAIEGAAKRAADAGLQVVPVAVLGHKADVAFMVLGPDLWDLKAFQSAILASGLDLADSYVSLTELSEYAQGVPEEMKQARLFPKLPPEGKKAWCFYGMSKRRGEKDNWFALPYDERKELMYEHGASGRKFAGRVLQVVTGSTGIDDFEWGVTLFAEKPDDLKEVVYTMRFDRASTLYGEFGPFVTGMIGELGEVLDAAGIGA